MVNKRGVSEIIATVLLVAIVIVAGGLIYVFVVPMIRDSLKSVTAIGNFSEEEGLKKLSTLKKVDLVLIGGRYSEEQRIRIRAYLKEHFPGVSTTEPGYQYPYDNTEILDDIKKKLRILA